MQIDIGVRFVLRLLGFDIKAKPMNSEVNEPPKLWAGSTRLGPDQQTRNEVDFYKQNEASLVSLVFGNAA